VSKDRLAALSKSLANVTEKTIDDLMVPEDLDDSSLLVPIEVSDEAVFGEVYDGHEELVERLGAKGVAEAVIAAAKLFEKNQINFKAAERPIAMTVKDWKGVPGDETDDDDEDEAEDEDEDAEDDDGEEGEEEDGEEDEEAEDDEPAAKKAKKA